MVLPSPADAAGAGSQAFLGLIVIEACEIEVCGPVKNAAPDPPGSGNYGIVSRKRPFHGR
jgi:hypothetical protein